VTKRLAPPLPAIKSRCQQKSDWRSALKAFRCSLGSAIQVNRSHAILGGSLGNIFRRQAVSVIERLRRLINRSVPS
jgi:hypothetical protein